MSKYKCIYIYIQCKYIHVYTIQWEIFRWLKFSLESKKHLGMKFSIFSFHSGIICMCARVLHGRPGDTHASDVFMLGKKKRGKITANEDCYSQINNS